MKNTSSWLKWTWSGGPSPVLCHPMRTEMAPAVDSVVRRTFKSSPKALSGSTCSGLTMVACGDVWRAFMLSPVVMRASLPRNVLFAGTHGGFPNACPARAARRRVRESTAPVVVVDLEDHDIEALFRSRGSDTHLEGSRWVTAGSIGPLHDLPSPAHDPLLRIQSSNLEHRSLHGRSAELRHETIHVDLIALTKQAPADP